LPGGRDADLASKAVASGATGGGTKGLSGLTARARETAAALTEAVNASRQARRSFSYRLVSGLPEIVGRARLVEHTLGQKHSDEVLAGIGEPICAEAAVPTVAAGHLRDFVGLRDDGHAETPAARRCS
jgi:hypothetical protein